MECVSVVDGGWLFDKKLQSGDLNEYTSIQDGIIAIIVLILYNFSSCCCLWIAAKRGSLGREVEESDRGKCKYFFFLDKKCCIV